MAVRTLSIWDGVPDADRLKEMLAAARDPAKSLTERQYALGWLTGATKVLAGLEKRQALADYLRRQTQKIKTQMYYQGDHDGRQAHG